jgi:hypothetical protein
MPVFRRKATPPPPAAPAPGRHRKGQPRADAKPAGPAKPVKPAGPPPDPCAGGHDTGIRYDGGATVVYCKRAGCGHEERYIG